MSAFKALVLCSIVVLHCAAAAGQGVVPGGAAGPQAAAQVEPGIALPPSIDGDLPVIAADPLPPVEAPPEVPPVMLPHDLTPWGMYQAADIVVKAVMAGLLLASVITWTVWLAKTFELFLLRRRLKAAILALARTGSLAEASERTLHLGGAAAVLVRAAATEMRLSPDMPASGIKERIASRLERLEAALGRRAGRGTGVLATIGSTAPFVGLFGTVWGIMNSFIGISKMQTTNLAVVAPGIAEALLATALGLVAAIPAVVIYNVFARRIGAYRGLLADAAAEIQRLAGRDLDRRHLPLARAAE